MAEARHPDLRARNTHVTCHQQHVTHDARHPHLPATQATHHQKGGACVQMRAGGDVRRCAWGMRAAEGGLGVCLACACVSHCACAPQGAFLSSRACVLSRVCALVVGLAFLSSRGALQVPSTHTHTHTLHLPACTHRDAGPESEGTGLRRWAQSCSQRPPGPPRSDAGSTDIKPPG